MTTTAIICEYNPFTNGHLKHLKTAREQTASDTIICIMSGNFTQRGDAAILDKYQRAFIACKYGADIVIELPTISAISPAENFAYGAIRILNALPKIDYLSFGSECGDTNMLLKLSDLFEHEPNRLKALIKENLSLGISYPKAKAEALKQFCTENKYYAELSDLLQTPNNVLAIEYIRSLKRFNMSVKLHTIKREPNYNDFDLSGDYPSASAIRNALEENKFDRVKNAVPPLTSEFLENYNLRGTTLGDLCLYKLKDINGYELADYYDYSAGLNNRLKIAALNASTFDEFVNTAKNKSLTLTRLKRLSLYALFDITKQMYEDYCNAPVYIRILAIKKDRKDLISNIGKLCPNIITKYSDTTRIDKSLRPFDKLDFKAQGCLSIINRTNYYNNSMLIVD